mmetsp:Transcript_118481/g.330532  ORF Transcript_118481/g.330532 Transcript_118481/m.330532 type:complete len:420 (+) Transcript_118481:1679-2938(+)
MLPSHGRETVKVDPLPISDRTRSSPPWSSTICAQTARPRPIPWKFLASPFCSCSKGWKMRFCPSALMPLPVSVTSNSRRFFSGKWRTLRVTDPRSVNLQALESKLYRSCVSLWESPGMMGTCVLIKAFTRRTAGFTRGLFVLSMARLVMVTTSSARSPMSTGAVGLAAGLPSRCRFSLDASSMMFVTRSSSRLAQPLTMPSCLCTHAAALDSSIAPTSPIIPCRGLRISWEMTPMSTVFFACVSLSSAISDRSCPMATIPASVPSSVDLGTRLMASRRIASPECLSPPRASARGMEISTKFELACTKVTALTSFGSGGEESPCPALRTCFTAATSPSLLSALTKSFSRFAFTASKVNPVSFSKLSFQAVMRPSRSKEKTGSMAFLTTFSRSLLAARAASHQWRMEPRYSQLRIISKMAP